MVRTDREDMAKEWAEKLSGYSLPEIMEMFDRAIQECDSQTPFGVPQLLAAAQSINSERRQSLTVIPAERCDDKHNLVDAPREENDPPLIQSWRICSKCGSAFAKLNKWAQ